jgi:Lrp/AsnC family transcriptional regulator for asnA, asnC and gidA
MLDEVDRKIIIELQQDGRKSYASVAKELNLSLSTVSRRAERLLKDGIIRIMAVPNPTKVGNLAYAHIALDVEMSKLDNICKVLVDNPAVYFVGMAFGRFDVMAAVAFPSSEALADYIKNELAAVDGVRQIETFYIAELKKRTFGWLIDDRKAKGQEAERLAGRKTLP